MRNPEVLVVGAGIAGLMTAISLLRKGAGSDAARLWEESEKLTGVRIAV